MYGFLARARFPFVNIYQGRRLTGSVASPGGLPLPPEQYINPFVSHREGIDQGIPRQVSGLFRGAKWDPPRSAEGLRGLSGWA
jgi:hypothetical protein